MRYKIKLFWGKLGPYCPFAQKGDFLRKLTNENIVYLLCPIMLQFLKTFLSAGHITRYKVLQFWLKLDTNYRFTLKGVFLFFFFEKLTDVNFAYFMYRTLSKCYNVQKKSLKWITRYKVASFLDKLAQGIFFGKINYRYFCQSAVPHHTKKFKLKKSLQRIKICKIQQFWFSLLGLRINRSPALVKNLLILCPNTRKISLLADSPSKCLFSSSKYQLPCFNPMKTSLLGFWLLPLLLLHFILTLYFLYSQVMLFLILIIVPCLENVVNFEKGSDSQNHSLSDSHNPRKIFFIAKFTIALTWNGENKTIKTSF